MVQFLKKSLVFLTSVAIVSTALVSINEKSVLAGSEKESIAPDFTLENVNGENVSLKDFRGSIVVLGMVFGDKAAHDIEKYRGPLNSDFKGKGIKFLKVVQVNKPIFITKGFIRSKMKKQFKYSPDAPKLTLIDWGGALDLGAKYGINDKDTPAIFIIGKEGEILFSFQGWYSDDNLSKLEKELSTILMGSSEHQGKMIRIGVTQISFSSAFEQAQEGFKSALEEAGYVEGKNVIYDHQDAQGDLDKNRQIAQKFINDKVNMIHIMSSPTAEHLVNLVKEIPIIFSVVINPVEIGAVPAMGPSGTNVTGVGVHICPIAKQWPVNSQIEMYVKFVPSVKKWGTIYNAKSANTRHHIKELRETIKILGLELVEAPVSEADEVKEAAKSLVGKAEAVYITSDEIPMSVFEDIAEVCNQNKIPLFGGELECVSRGAIAAYNQDYFLTGYKAGEKAVRVLNGEKPGDIPSELTKLFYLAISLKNAEKQGLTIPEELKKRGDKIL
jgi:putative ABC transport system substrate-binding protein